MVPVIPNITSIVVRSSVAGHKQSNADVFQTSVACYHPGVTILQLSSVDPSTSSGSDATIGVVFAIVGAVLALLSLVVAILQLQKKGQRNSYGGRRWFSQLVCRQPLRGRSPSQRQTRS